jgi:hypothetical protein
MCNGNDPLHLKVYHTTIVLQNQYPASVSTLPVISISAKTMQQQIQLGAAAQERLIDILNRCKYFSSIRPTVQLEKLGKYLFTTTSAQFEAAKKLINTTKVSMQNTQRMT